MWSHKVVDCGVAVVTWIGWAFVCVTFCGDNTDLCRTYVYDGLSRLVRASQGELNPAGDGFAAGVLPETTLWDLDELGNWSGDDQEASLLRFLDADADATLDGEDEILASVHHDANASNEIDAVITSDVDTNSVQYYGYDEAGNLIYDGGTYNVYDPWNRLVAMYQAGALVEVFEGDVGTGGLRSGGVDLVEALQYAGDQIAGFEYDALGRRVRTVKWPDSPREKTTEHVYGSGANVLEEYDVATNGMATLERWFVHGTSFPDPLVMFDLTDEGDRPAGDEEPLYYLKDALGSVGALANSNGEIVERYAYDPYGRTFVMDADGELLKPVDPLSGSFYHDHDLDGMIDAGDLRHLMDCVESGEHSPLCVFVHDRNGDRKVDFVDLGVFLAFADFDSNGTPAPEMFGRPQTIPFDADGDGHIDVFDFYGLQLCFASTTGLCVAIYDVDADEDITTNDLASFIGDADSPGPPQWSQGVPASRYGNPFMWTGQRSDTTAGQYHFPARTYTFSTGGWVQRDPLGYVDGVNLFQYVASNPLTSVDPLGLIVRVSGSGDRRKQIEGLLRKVSPGAHVNPKTGYVTIDEDADAGSGDPYLLPERPNCQRHTRRNIR